MSARKKPGKSRRGRPSRQHAKRRATTRHGRRTGRDHADPGTGELLAKRRHVTGHEWLSHEDPLAMLFGRGLLTASQFNAGREIAELIATLSRDRLASVWRRILEGPGSWSEPDAGGHARRALRTLLRLKDRMGSESTLVFAVCGGAWWATRHIAAITLGLDRVARYWSMPGNNITDQPRYYSQTPPRIPLQLSA